MIKQTIVVEHIRIASAKSLADVARRDRTECAEP
jgi:hypothetical protein